VTFGFSLVMYDVKRFAYSIHKARPKLNVYGSSFCCCGGILVSVPRKYSTDTVSFWFVYTDDKLFTDK